MIRVLCARLGSPYDKIIPPVAVRTCSQCGHRVWTHRETLVKADTFDEPYEIWCVQCNYAAAGWKKVYRPDGTFFFLPPPPPPN